MRTNPGAGRAERAGRPPGYDGGRGQAGGLVFLPLGRDCPLCTLGGEPRRHNQTAAAPAVPGRGRQRPEGPAGADRGRRAPAAAGSQCCCRYRRALPAQAGRAGTRSTRDMDSPGWKDITPICPFAKDRDSSCYPGLLGAPGSSLDLGTLRGSHGCSGSGDCCWSQ